MSRMFAEDSLRYLMYENPLPAAWSLNDFKFAEETLHSFTMRGLYDATNPDLSAFNRHGGKLILWHGWSDPHISPINSIGYFDAVARQAGAQNVQSFARLFLIPGLYHCSGGEGATKFDVLSELMAWVEQGKAPEALTLKPDNTTQAATSSASSRPVYPYPDVARRVDDAAASQAGAYRRIKASIHGSSPLDWAGASFFTSGYEINCDAGVLSQCASSAR